MATTPIEHKSTQAAFQKIRGWGARVGEVSVDSSGHIVLEELESLCKQGLSFFSFIYAHNEIGTIQKLNKALPLLKSFGVTVHLDLSQAIGKIPVSLRELDIDFASFTAHKFGGPQGVGALYKNLSSKSSLEGLFAGDAEFERLGTPPVALIAGFGKAAELMSQELAGLTSQWTALRQSLLAGLQALDPHLIVNGCPHHHLPHSLSVSLPGLVPHRLAALATTLAVSSGSACISLAPGSATLTALGVPLSLQRQTLRFGLGQNTGPEDIKGALNLLKPVFSGA